MIKSASQAVSTLPVGGRREGCKHIKAVKIRQSGEIRQTRGPLRLPAMKTPTSCHRIVIPDSRPPAPFSKSQ